MKRLFKRGFALILMLMMFTVTTNIFAATIGAPMTNSEEGWTRSPWDNILITYEGNGWFNNNGYDTLTQDKNAKIKFYFKGSDLRILGFCASNRASHKIIIDNEIVDTYSNSILATTSSYTLIYEKLGLEDKVHSVEIQNVGDSSYFGIRSIDLRDGTIVEKLDSDIVLDIEPEKDKIKLGEEVIGSLVIDNIEEIAAEDITIRYDSDKLEYLGHEEVNGIKLVYNDETNGELRFILASKGESNIINNKTTLLKLKFKGISKGEALVDIIKGKISDGIEMEKDLVDEECDEATIIIEGATDVNHSGEFTLLDLAIDARHLNKDPNSSELSIYNTDIVVNNAIDEEDLLEIGKYMLLNPNYTF